MFHLSREKFLLGLVKVTFFPTGPLGRPIAGYDDFSDSAFRTYTVSLNASRKARKVAIFVHTSYHPGKEMPLPINQGAVRSSTAEVGV